VVVAGLTETAMLFVALMKSPLRAAACHFWPFNFEALGPALSGHAVAMCLYAPCCLLGSHFALLVEENETQDYRTGPR